MSDCYFAVPSLSRKDLARIFSRIEIDPQKQINNVPCWTFTGAKSQRYGVICLNGKRLMLHRVIYAWVYGAIPQYNGSDLEVHHKCENKKCCNPAHLALVTHKENCYASPSHQVVINSTKTCCPAGHPYDDQNTYQIPAGGRDCKTCNRARSRRRNRTEARKAYMAAYKKQWRERKKQETEGKEYTL